MENKYYTPSLEELHIGFICELGGYSDNWEQIVIKSTHYPLIFDYFDTLRPLKQIRVKYLNQSDIESLGWDFNSEHLGPYLKFKFTNSFRYLYFYAQDNKIIIDNGGWFEDNVQYFQGNIKNKSELIKLMKQIGIK